MLKENGRYKKEDRKASASTKVNKEFKCTGCGVLKRVSNVEFGEVVKCMKCGANMEEV